MKINKKNAKMIVMFLITLIINIPIQYFQNFSGIKSIYNIMQLVNFAFFIILLIKRNKIEKLFILICLYYISYIFSTFMNSESVEYCLYILKCMIPCLNLIALVILFYKKYDKQLLGTTSFFMIGIIIINFITILLFPNGLYVGNNTNEHYFLGQRNDLIEYILPCLLCFSIYNYKYKTSKFVFYVFNFICMYSVILTWSANAMLALFCTYIYLFFFSNKRTGDIFNPLKIYIISFLTSYSIIVLKVQNLFSWIIEGILHKNLTFTGRTYIWDKSIEYIKKSFLFGYGKESEIIKLYKIGHGNSSHNYFLDFLYEGGIIMFSIILFIILNLNKSYKQCTNIKYKNITVSILIGYFIIGIATPIHLNTICYLFYSWYILKYLLSEKTEIQINEK